jgi:hypothetical protein
MADYMYYSRFPVVSDENEFGCFKQKESTGNI